MSRGFLQRELRQQVFIDSGNGAHIFGFGFAAMHWFLWRSFFFNNGSTRHDFTTSQASFEVFLHLMKERNLLEALLLFGSFFNGADFAGLNKKVSVLFLYKIKQKIRVVVTNSPFPTAIVL